MRRRELTAPWLEMQTEIVMNSQVCLIVEALADKVTSLIKLEKVHFQGRLLDVKWLRSALEQAEFKVEILQLGISERLRPSLRARLRVRSPHLT